MGEGGSSPALAVPVLGSGMVLQALPPGEAGGYPAVLESSTGQRLQQLLTPVFGPPGIYVCTKCGYELFSSRSKYAHSSPWPAFTETIHADSVTKCPEDNRPGALKVLPAGAGHSVWSSLLRPQPGSGHPDAFILIFKEDLSERQS